MTQTNQMIPIGQAWRTIAECVRPLGPQTVPLEQALGCVLAQDLCADSDYPPFDRAMMDGFAVRSADCGSGSVWLAVVQQLAAGDAPAPPLKPGQAARINTGAAVPQGADAVVMVEQTRTSPDEKRVWISEPVRANQNIAAQGSDRTAGQVVLQAGQRLHEPQLAVAAAIGAARASVRRRPRMAILATGSELVPPDRAVQPGQIRNSNGPCLSALASRVGCLCQDLGIVGDDAHQMRQRMAEALGNDVLCLTGGVSMGQLDLVPDVLEQLGVRIHLHKIAIKPGKPTLFGTTANGCCVFGLPGNPVSCFVVFVLLVEPALARLQGLQAGPPPPIRAKLVGQVPRTKDRDAYLPARWQVQPDGELTVEPVPWHGPGDVFGLAEANGLIVRPASAPQATSGQEVLMIPFWWQR
jgi:molybdopterin molybdotransferase